MLSLSSIIGGRLTVRLLAMPAGGIDGRINIRERAAGLLLLLRGAIKDIRAMKSSCASLAMYYPKANCL